MTDGMSFEIAKNLCERAVVAMVSEYIGQLLPDDLFPIADSEALGLIVQIKDILDEEDTSDPECFRRIDAIVNAFAEKGIYTNRHDW